jgi:TPR repeat protein
MNNYSFLDSSVNSGGMPRASPSPSPSQASMNGLPSGGQQTDMNHLWGVVQQLSQLLEENKAQTAGVLNGVAALQQRAAEEGGAIPSSSQVNGELSGASLAIHAHSVTTRTV